MNKIRGLPIEEKMMLIRMGELIDKGINQRTPTNPNPSRGFQRKEIPIPNGLDVAVSARGAILSWNKIDSNNLLNYRTRITPIDGEGDEVIATSYSNQYFFKGNGGRYRFATQSISRDGKSSAWSDATEFTVYDAPIILEGNKLDVEEFGAQISETVLTPENYTVFVFTSIVLDTLASATDNTHVTVQLSYGETFEASILIQELLMYQESEDLCNLVTGISRPSGTPSRTGNFQTTQSIMFAPFQITTAATPDIVNRETKFWINATGRDDIVGMSCAIWVALEAEAAAEVTLPSLFEAPTDGYWHAQYIFANGGSTGYTVGADDRSTQQAIFRDIPPVTPDNLAADLVDVVGGYVLFWSIFGAVQDAVGADLSCWSIREGATTSTDLSVVADAPGDRIIDHRLDVSVDWNHGFVAWSQARPIVGSGGIAEWGLFGGNQAANLFNAAHASLIIMPTQNSTGTLAIQGSHLGFNGSEWFVTGAATLNFDTQAGGDRDQIIIGTTPLTIDHGGEDYLLFFRARLNTATATGGVALRWTWGIDTNEDIFNIRTNKMTSGATRTGRGFQLRAPGETPTTTLTAIMTGFRVVQFNAGTGSFNYTGNRHESADNLETITNPGVFVIRTGMLSQFTYSEYDQAILVTSNALTTAPWSVTLTSDGIAPIVIGFTSSQHTQRGYADFVVMRDSTEISVQQVGGLLHLGMSRCIDITDGTDGTGDTDNQTLPVTFLIVDEPAAGSHTYTIQYRRNTSAAQQGGNSLSSIINCRDNGSSGFIGTLFAFELKFATVF